MSEFRVRLERGERQIGCFVKTPAHEVIEVLALSGLDLVCLDAEHAAFGRREMDACLAIAAALGLPALVRVSEAEQREILAALDSGATGLLLPLICSAEQASQAVRWARYGDGGRGYAGSTRSAGFGTRSMAEVQAAAGDLGPVLFAQIEDVAAVSQAEEILAVDGITGVFFGAADLTAGFGITADDGRVQEAFTHVATAARKVGKPLAGFASGAAASEKLVASGATMILAGSDQSMLAQGARDLLRMNAVPARAEG